MQIEFSSMGNLSESNITRVRETLNATSPIEPPTYSISTISSSRLSPDVSDVDKLPSYGEAMKLPQIHHRQSEDDLPVCDFDLCLKTSFSIFKYLV